MRRLALAVLTLAALLFVVPTVTAPAAHASTRAGNAAMDWAYTQWGCWYSYGGTSCSPGYDCSGLVQRAFAHGGVALPRTVDEMVRSGHLHRTYAPTRGDVAVWFSGGVGSHIEIVTKWWHQTFGAQHTGTRVGYHYIWGSPVYYYVT